MEKSKDSFLDMVKLGLILVCYAVASCTVLAVVNNFTSPKIKENQIKKAEKAMASVMPEADSFDFISDFDKGESQKFSLSDFYVAKKDGNIIGAVVQVQGPTYDKGKIIVGVYSDGIISGMEFLELSDSPGFGLKANDPLFLLPSGKTFYGQFTGKNASDGFSGGSNFDSISGATITSHAAGELVNYGIECILKYFSKNIFLSGDALNE